VPVSFARGASRHIDPEVLARLVGWSTRWSACQGDRLIPLRSITAAAHSVTSMVVLNVTPVTVVMSHRGVSYVNSGIHRTMIVEWATPTAARP
jgi:hypothetical protein